MGLECGQTCIDVSKEKELMKLWSHGLWIQIRCNFHISVFLYLHFSSSGLLSDGSPVVFTLRVFPHKKFCIPRVYFSTLFFYLIVTAYPDLGTHLDSANKFFFDRKQQLYILIEKELQKKDEESSLQR